MRVNFRAKNFNLTNGAKEQIEKKINSLEGMFNEDTAFDVHILKREKDYKCEIKVQKGKDFIRCEEKGKSIEFSVDNAINSLKKRVRKIKSLRITKKRGNDALAMKEYIRSGLEEEKAEKVDLGIARRKQLTLESMTEEDAVMLIEALNHSFFVFMNKDKEDAVCVLYRRDKGYGMLETDIA